MGPGRARSDERLSAIVRWTGAVAWLGGLVALTLTPAGGPVRHIVSACLLCGHRGAADALLNVVLFVPLGLLVGARRSAAVALGVGVGLSAGVEIGQLLLAGRYSNAGDLLWNGLGAYLGALAAPALRARLDGGRNIAAPAAAVLLPAAWMLSAGALLAPAPVGDGASLVRPDASRGSVVSKAARRTEDAVAPRVRWAELDLDGGSGWRVTAEMLPVPTHREEAPIATIYGTDGRALRVLRSDGGDLVLWERTMAEAVGFDRADLRLAGGAWTDGHGPAATVSASESVGDGVCLRSGARRACGLGVSPARTWTLLRSAEHGTAGQTLAVDLAWMAVITALTGVLGGGVRTALGAIAAVLLMLWAAPHVTALVASGWPEIAGAALGVGSGTLARPLLRLALHAPSDR